MFFSLGTSKIDFSKEVAKYLYKELKQENIEVVKDNILIYIFLNDDEYLMIDCVDGKIYHTKDNEEKYFCMLSNFKNKTHLGEAYNCAVFNVKKIIKKIDELKNKELVKESSLEEIIDLREVEKEDLEQEDFEQEVDQDEIIDLRKGNFILFINNALYEGKSKLKLIKEFFKKQFNITDSKKIKESINNKEYINKYGDAYKDDYNKEIYININSLINMKFNEFYNILKEQYPEFYIKNNRAIKQIDDEYNVKFDNCIKQMKRLQNNVSYIKSNRYKQLYNKVS